ncbi:MAG: pentapeptide repeat-containing protein, partial [Chromatiales bacterium]
MTESMPVSNEIIDADMFVAALKRGDMAEIEHKRVRGAVQFRGESVTFPMRALYTCFEGEVDFTGTKFEGGADFSGCTFSKTVAFRNVRVVGDFILDDVDVLDMPSLWGKRLPDAVSLNLNGLQVEGNFILDRTTVHGAVFAKGLQVERNASIRGCEINSPDLKDINAITLDNARIGGDFYFGCWAQYGSHYGKDGAYRESLVRGSVSATNIRVKGTVIIAGLQVLGDLSCWGSVFESTIFVKPFMKQANDGASVVAHTMVSGTLSFSAAKISGHLEIESTRVGGLLKLLSLESGTIVLGIFERCQPWRVKRRLVVRSRRRPLAAYP